MTWSIEQIGAAISSAPDADLSGAGLSLEIYDEELGVGIGVDSESRAVLVLPGQSELPAFETSALKFDPWCEAVWVERDLRLPMSAVLRCTFDHDDPSLIQIVAGVLGSLVDLQARFQDAGQAIWVMRSLFSDGFRATPDRAAVVGLLGELVVLLSLQDPTEAVKAWHAEKLDRYDFSWNSRRLEVKATAGTSREHRFNSHQLPSVHGIEVWVASVLLSVVEIGDSVADLFEQVVARLPRSLASKVASLVTETVGLPPALVTEPQIDLSASRASVRIYKGTDIPTPVLVAGASNLRWTAFLDELLGREIGVLDQVLPGEDGG